MDAEERIQYVDLFRKSLDRSELDEVMDCMREGDLARAEQFCKTLMDESGGVDGTIWAVLGLNHLLKRDYDRAFSAIDRAVELAPESTLTMNIAGDFATFTGDFANGEQFYLMSMEKNPEQEHPRVMLGSQYNHQQRYEDAVEVLLPIFHLSPENKLVWRQLRVAVGCMSDRVWEEEIARSLLKRFPEHYMTWFMVGNSLMNQRRPREAVKYCKQAIELCKNEDLTWTLYGTVLNMLGKQEAALICFKKAVQLNNDEPKNWEGLSLTYFMTGDLKQAMRAADRVIRLAPEEAKDLVAFLEEQLKEERTERRSMRRRRKKEEKRNV